MNTSHSKTLALDITLTLAFELGSPLFKLYIHKGAPLDAPSLHLDKLFKSQHRLSVLLECSLMYCLCWRREPGGSHQHPTRNSFDKHFDQSFINLENGIRYFIAHGFPENRLFYFIRLWKCGYVWYGERYFFRPSQTTSSDLSEYTRQRWVVLMGE